MSRPNRSSGRRIAERPPSRFAGLRRRATGLRRRAKEGRKSVLSRGWTLWGSSLVVAAVLVVCVIFGVGPSWFDQVAAVIISTAYVIALAVRAGGRPVVFGFLALLLGVMTLVADVSLLRTGAAVLTAALSAVFAVMMTVPAVRYRHAVREVGVVLLISGVGAFAAIGYRPEVAIERVDYVALLIAFPLAAGLVYNLGAGLHGLGRRGAIVVLLGSAGVALTLAYAELLRRYGAETFVNDVLQGVTWMRTNLGAAPRPIQLFVGVPAIVWGCHVRARRRQGWWVCAFGVALTTSVSGLLMNPSTGWLEALLIVIYSATPGLGLGYILIRIDLALTGPRGRRARRQEERSALRPEPSRFQALL